MVWPCLKGTTQWHSAKCTSFHRFLRAKVSLFCRDFFPHGTSALSWLLSDLWIATGSVSPIHRVPFPMKAKGFTKVMILENLEREPYSSHNRRKSFWICWISKLVLELWCVSCVSSCFPALTQRQGKKGERCSLQLPHFSLLKSLAHSLGAGKFIASGYSHLPWTSNGLGIPGTKLLGESWHSESLQVFFSVHRSWRFGGRKARVKRALCKKPSLRHECGKLRFISIPPHPHQWNQTIL